MQIKVIENFAAPEAAYRKGVVYDVPEDRAVEYIAGKLAVAVEVKVEKKQNKPEAK